MSTNDSGERGILAAGSTPHLLGRPILFEIEELERPEPGILFRWTVCFSVDDAPEFIFDLKEDPTGFGDPPPVIHQCYELIENGNPCNFGRWHFGPETARTSVVAIVEERMKKDLSSRSKSRSLGRAQDLFGRLPLSFVQSLSMPGLEVLNLFRADSGASHS